MQRPTRRSARLALAVVVVAAGPVLSACDSLDSLEIFDTKKKLAGDRKEVFPEGVPGVTSGVPPELVKGYREQEGATYDPAKAAAEAAAEPAAKPKKPKVEPKPQRTASKPAPKPQAQQPDPSPVPTRVAAPEPAQQPAPQATSPWPVAQPQTAWPASPGAVSR
jgi:outer membrane biosynthesis protein TonB